MKRILTCLFLLCITVVFGQNQANLRKLPKEKLFLHLNTTFLVSGETLYYKLYCINSSDDQLSELSKIAYVEIISEEKKSIFKEKIELTNGIGYSDFFIPSAIKSGTYKLIAYTNLMRNANSFFASNLFVVNPFREDQSTIIDTTAARVASTPSATKTKPIAGKHISLDIKAGKLTTRNNATLKITALNNEESFGEYSLSVKKKYAINSPTRPTSATYKNIAFQKNEDTGLRQFITPEFRGEILEGKVISKKTNTPVGNLKVALSVPQKNPIFKISNTNNDGVFYFNIHEEYTNTSAILQIIGVDDNDLEILVPEKKPVNYQQFQFIDQYALHKTHKDMLLSKSINYQIENSYESVKRDSIKEIPPVTSFFGNSAKDYYLDEYERFATLKETFVEVVENAWIARRGGRSYFKVKRDINNLDFDLGTLLLVDGILIQDHDDIVDLDPKKIEKISIVRDQYIYGPHIFEGIIAIETFDGGYHNVTNKKVIQLFKTAPRKKYFSPNYSKISRAERIPDFRDQLLWKPEISINRKETTISFFTSDEKGSYEVSLEGFTHRGFPVTIKKEIIVE